MIYFTAHTFKCVCHCRRVMFRVLGMYNFGLDKDFLFKPVVGHCVSQYMPLSQTSSYFSSAKRRESDDNVNILLEPNWIEARSKVIYPKYVL